MAEQNQIIPLEKNHGSRSRATSINHSESENKEDTTSSTSMILEGEGEDLAKNGLDLNSSSSSTTLLETIYSGDKSAFKLKINQGVNLTTGCWEERNICHVLAARNLTEWANICVEKMSKVEKKAFISSGKGKIRLALALTFFLL